jgi:hypothetical protein
MTRCEWAGCRAPSVEIVEQWPMCAEHKAEHEALFPKTSKPPVERGVPLDLYADVIRELNAAGWTDKAIADLLGCSDWKVRRRRQDLGLSPVSRTNVPKPIAHGTERGAAQHYRRGDAPCRACQAASSKARKRREAS